MHTIAIHNDTIISIMHTIAIHNDTIISIHYAHYSYT